MGIELRFEKENINSMSGDGELMLSIWHPLRRKKAVPSARM